MGGNLIIWRGSEAAATMIDQQGGRWYFNLQPTAGIPPKKTD
ncbi:MAG: hypothetical protein RL211_1825 [Pseudomonadota bacterium]|jgi:hypothetical protein